MSDLNLLPSEAKFQAERMRLNKIINKTMWALGGGWLIFVIIILMINLFAQLRLNNLKKKYQQSFDQYKSLAGSVLISQKIKHQAKVVAMVLKQRFEYGNSMEKIENIFSEKIVVDNFELGEDKKKYIIKALVQDPIDIDEVEMKIDDINLGRIEGFKSAQLKSLELVKDNGWQFVMEVILL